MIFVTKKDLKVKNGGYLVSSDKPVTNRDFVIAQRSAEILVKVSEAVEKADFTTKTPDNYAQIYARVVKDIQDTNQSYIDAPSAPKRKVTDSLKKEAMSWINFQIETELANDVNAKMQEFNIVKDFEEFGLYFEEGVTKLNKIYTIADILKAVKILDKHS